MSTTSVTKFPCSTCGGSKPTERPIVWGTGLVNGQKCEECDGKGWFIPDDPDSFWKQLSERYPLIGIALAIAAAMSVIAATCEALK